jgi:hypothetical protein
LGSASKMQGLFWRKRESDIDAIVDGNDVTNAKPDRYSWLQLNY